MSDTNPKCAVCGRKLKRGERRACRKCVVAVATLRAVKNPGGGKTCAIADFVVTALNEFAEKPGTYFTPKAVLDVVANDMAGRLPDVVIANPPMGDVE